MREQVMLVKTVGLKLVKAKYGQRGILWAQHFMRIGGKIPAVGLIRGWFDSVYHTACNFNLNKNRGNNNERVSINEAD